MDRNNKKVSEMPRAAVVRYAFMKSLHLTPSEFRLKTRYTPRPANGSGLATPNSAQESPQDDDWDDDADDNEGCQDIVSYVTQAKDDMTPEKLSMKHLLSYLSNRERFVEQSKQFSDLRMGHLNRAAGKREYPATPVEVAFQTARRYRKLQPRSEDSTVNCRSLPLTPRFSMGEEKTEITVETKPGKQVLKAGPIGEGLERPSGEGSIGNNCDKKDHRSPMEKALICHAATFEGKRRNKLNRLAALADTISMKTNEERHATSRALTIFKMGQPATGQPSLSQPPELYPFMKYRRASFHQLPSFSATANANTADALRHSSDGLRFGTALVGGRSGTSGYYDRLAGPGTHQRRTRSEPIRLPSIHDSKYENDSEADNDDDNDGDGNNRGKVKVAARLGLRCEKNMTREKSYMSDLERIQRTIQKHRCAVAPIAPANTPVVSEGSPVFFINSESPARRKVDIVLPTATEGMDYAENCSNESDTHSS